jgi:L-asparaginase
VEPGSKDREFLDSGRRVLPHCRYDGGGKTVAVAVAVMVDDLSPQKVRVLLMLLLQSGVTATKARQAAFDR